MKLMINIPDEAYELLKSKSELDNIAESIIANGTPISTKGDLISRSDLKKVFDNLGYLTVKIERIIDNAPTVCGNNPKWCESCVSNGKCASTRSQGELANEVLELYEKYHSHLATRVIEFGDELKELLGKYQEGGAEE